MGLMYNVAGMFIATLATAISLFGGPSTAALAPPTPAFSSNPAAQTALILTAPLAASSTGNTSTAPTATSEFISGLLPKVALLKTVAAESTTPAATKPTKPAVAAPPATASAILGDTTTTLERRIGGAYGLVFNAVANGRKFLSWQYGATPIGGTGGVPQFSATYSCVPPPVPLFAVRTSYDCTVSLTPLSGSDRRTMSQNFSFATGPGEFSASPPANMNTHLVNDQNDGGFVFTNDDTKPVSVLSETFDVTYTGLSTQYGPLVLRLVDPSDATHYLDYHMENFPAVSSSSFTHSAAGITLSFPVTVDASNQKLLPIEVLGVHKLSIVGVNPTVTITLRGVTTDRSDIAMQLGTPHISWRCVVTLGYYDPNATSGPFATGEACQN
jgi:hypothetical protein